MKKIRTHIVLFVMLLSISGLTAFPLKREIDYIYRYFDYFPRLLKNWISTIHHDIYSTPEIMFYGTDWLAFSHIIISLFFIPVYLNPPKYKTNIYVAIIACVLVLPLALICGPIRNIPFFHQLIDCSFGIIGLMYLLYILHLIQKLNTTTYDTHH